MYGRMLAAGAAALAASFVAAPPAAAQIQGLEIIAPASPGGGWDQTARSMQQVLQQTHLQFIAAVKAGRGDRLQMTDEITSGLIWNGEQALGLGLIDGLGGVRYVAREVVGEEELRDYTVKGSPLKMLLQDFGVSVGKGIAWTLKGDGIPELR